MWSDETSSNICCQYPQYFMIIKMFYIYFFFLKYVFCKVVLFFVFVLQASHKMWNINTFVRYRANSSFGIYGESNYFVWDKPQKRISLRGIHCKIWFLCAGYAAETDSSVQYTPQKLTPLCGIHYRNWFLCVGYTAETDSSMWDTLQRLRPPRVYVEETYSLCRL